MEMLDAVIDTDPALLEVTPLCDAGLAKVLYRNYPSVSDALPREEAKKHLRAVFLLMPSIRPEARDEVVGGLIGCLLGLAGIQGIARWTAWQAIVEPHYVLVALGISCFVGIVFGIYPARRAAQMNPITALRHE